MMESIAPADVSLPNTPDTEMVQIPRSNPYSIFSLFPPAKSSTGTPWLPLPHFSPSIPSFFPPENSPSISLSPQTKNFSPYSIPSFFPPTSEHGFQISIPSIFQPNYSYSPSIESPRHHQQFTESHFQKPNITRWRRIKFYVFDNERIFPQQVEAEFEQAQERWTYAIYWEFDRPSDSPLWGTFSPVKGFYNVEDHKFNNKALTLSFFQFMESWSNIIFGSVLSQVFSTSSPIWVVGKACLKGSKYYRAREGRQYGLKTMCWIRVADGVMEFGSTELIYPP
ncbi:hypothetical protein ACB092_07G059900 [Castanea dentata]